MGQQRDTTPRAFSIPRPKGFPCGSLWTSLGWPHIILSSLKDSGPQNSCSRPPPWLLVSEPRLGGPREVGGKVGDSQRGSERAECVRAKGQVWYAPCNDSNTNNDAGRMGHLLSSRPCAKHFAWISSRYRSMAQHIREFPRRFQLMGMGKQRPLMEEAGRRPKPSHGGAGRELLTCPSVEVSREPELDWGGAAWW